jgi:hypothetical protein
MGINMGLHHSFGQYIVLFGQFKRCRLDVSLIAPFESRAKCAERVCTPVELRECHGAQRSEIGMILGSVNDASHCFIPCNPGA